MSQTLKEKFSKMPVLIANRGEIAIRVARTAKRLGFPTVAVYSEADKASEHVRVCDTAVNIGPAESRLSYLAIEKIIEAAKKTGAKFIHPGYGFLSERPLFVEACEKAGITFVGPSSESMKVMGDKITARTTVDSLGVPGVPGSKGAIASAAEAAKIAKEIGYPVLLKATAGGGGKGMRRVDKESEIAGAFEGAGREALAAFGDGSMYVEKYILKPHHVEIQVFGDGKGGAMHLGERECSIQRRHQKVWEESPAPILNRFEKTREKMFEASVRIASHIKYAGAGTFEYIVDEEGNFYFLEMNTRLQVEHPVSEWVTGVDLVAWQLLLAAGEWKLPSAPVSRRGSAIEVRIYAEDSENFLPGPGRIGLMEPPSGPFIRWDSAYSLKGEVSLHYDPMISKLSVWAPTRDEACERLRVALDELRIEPERDASGRVTTGLKTNLEFLRRLVRNDRTLKGDTTTDLIALETSLTQVPEYLGKTAEEKWAAVAVSLFQQLRAEAAVHVGGDASGTGAGDGLSVWASNSRREGVRR
jgi:acetyl-CoA carboxylase, biotin carboxylase subunit